MARALREPAIGWRLPPFYCPIEPAIHPRAAELERRAVSWLDSTGLFRDEKDRAWSIATHSTDFSCRMIPYGRDEPLLLFIQWNHWAFALDDICHDTGSADIRTAGIVDLNARISRCLEAPGSAMLGSTPFDATLEDLAARTRAMTTPTQLRRVTEGMRDWLFGAAWQVSNIERRVMPTLSDYVALRPSVNGTRFSLSWSEIAGGIEVPDGELYSAPVQALTEAAGFIVSCDNDLFSYAKEDSQETTDQNIVNVLIHHDGSSPAQALGDAVAIRDRVMTLFLELRDQIARDAGAELRRYLQALGHYIAGCIRWMNEAPRYASPRNRHDLPVPGATYGITWRDTPSDPGTGPLPIASAAWWWDQLDASSHRLRNHRVSDLHHDVRVPEPRCGDESLAAGWSAAGR
ncbi:terpene synthase family protein [Streptomyces cinnamoneus]|uniref:terpene synthase family protein n=1 Tax=Streptomyces cinnamoneus TaxID=53446 RepID=UPI0015E30AAA|nr:terpene synthase family protein [Streptomyces cinnamoneus]